MNYFSLHFWQDVKLRSMWQLQWSSRGNIEKCCGCVHVIYFGWETLGTLNKLRTFPLIQCVWVNDGAVLTFKEQQTRGNVLLHLCITIMTWKTLLPIRSVCVCVCKSQLFWRALLQNHSKFLFYITIITNNSILNEEPSYLNFKNAFEHI